VHDVLGIRRGAAKPAGKAIGRIQMRQDFRFEQRPCAIAIDVKVLCRRALGAPLV
jgi:hypothetical protein